MLNINSGKKTRPAPRGTIVLSDPALLKLRFAALLTVFGLLGGCADTRGGAIAYDQTLAPPDAPSLTALESNYKIAPMDKLAVKVFKSDDLSGDYDVDLAGHISLPLIGEVEAANLTTAELDQRLIEKLGAKYLEHPDVSVSIKLSAGRLVTIDGAVKDSGSFPVAGSLTLLQAVALAKGTSEDANPRRIAIFRTINGKRQAAAFDLQSIRPGQAPDPPIYAGDIVVVDGSSVKGRKRNFSGAGPKTAARDTFIEDLKTPASVVSEAYSAIVAALRFSTEVGMPKILLVTSTQSGEGKSSTALALAQNFARREKSVLLIDGDLRKPAFKTASDKIGLTKLLTNDERLDNHVVETQHDNLRLLPRGPIPPNPADLLSTGRMRRIIAEAEEQFDVVLVDGPPTLGLADAPLLSSVSGNVLFVVESGSTRTRAAIEALNRLESTGAHVLGAALTKASTEAGYGYGRYGY